MGDITRGLLLSPGAVHPQVRTCYQIHHQQYSQLSVFLQDKYTVLSMGVFFFPCHLAFVTSRVSITKFMGKEWRKNRTHSTYWAWLEQSNAWTGAAAWMPSLLYILDPLWISTSGSPPLLLKIKSLLSHLLAKSKMTFSLAKRQHEYPISFIKC